MSALPPRPSSAGPIRKPSPATTTRMRSSKGDTTSSSVMKVSRSIEGSFDESKREVERSRSAERSSAVEVSVSDLGSARARSSPAPAPAGIPSNLLSKLEEVLSEVSQYLFLILTRAYFLPIQLQLIKQTISVMDERLTLTEDRVSTLLAMQRGVPGYNPAAQMMASAREQNQATSDATADQL